MQKEAHEKKRRRSNCTTTHYKAMDSSLKWILERGSAKGTLDESNAAERPGVCAVSQAPDRDLSDKPPLSKAVPASIYTTFVLQTSRTVPSWECLLVAM